VVSANSIVFVSLFLGLTAGWQQVEVTVDRAVAVVELRLDGEPAARLEEPPWRVEIDLGPELAPQHLEALAFDGEGGELGRARQWINLPRQRQEVRLLLERDGGRVTGGRLAWDSLEHLASSSVRLSFDGDEFEVADPSAFALPSHDAGRLHVLSAEVVFVGGATARADAVFGGEYGEVTATELTAVPVLADGRRLPRRAERAAGWLAVGGRPAQVVAVDHGSADLYAVADVGAGRHLEGLAVELQRRTGAARFNSPLYGVGLRQGDRLFLLHPSVQKSTSYDLFGITSPLLATNGGTAWQLASRRFVDESPGDLPQRLADAVAAAALEAAAGGRPRAVVLLLGPLAVDESRHTPQVVRRFLDRLGVPLAVWYVEQLDVSLRLAEEAAATRAEERRKLVPPGERVEVEAVDPQAIAEARRRRLGAAREAWGEVADVDDVAAWVELNGDLRKSVARQAVLWIDGAHPPGAVALGAAPPGVRLVTVDDVAGGGR